MSRRQHLTTGEAARLLNVSRSTVSRMVDAGTLRGISNPITGRRLIPSDSVTRFLRTHQATSARTEAGVKQDRHLCLTCRSTALSEFVRDVVDRHRGWELEVFEDGGDTLIHCASQPPDVLIIGTDIADIAPDAVIRALRKRHHARPFKILACLTPPHGAGAALTEADKTLAEDDWRDPTRLAATLTGMLAWPEKDKSTDDMRPHSYRRRWRRVPLHIPVHATAYRPGVPGAMAKGEATLLNVSEGGAFLDHLRFDHGQLPGDAFRLHLFADQDPLRNFDAHCRVVRLQSNGCLSAGVQFVRLSSANRQMISSLANVA